MNWQPSASFNSIIARAKLNRLIRDFFSRRDVLEVETPLLCQTTALDPHLQSWQVPAGNDTRYLQTSPEFCMKRLLAAGCGSIYQLCKAFRHEEFSKQHNPEFTLLEWYRPNWTLEQLMDEIEALTGDAASVFGNPIEPFPRITYLKAFQDALGLNPHRCETEELRQAARHHINGDFSCLDRSGLLDLLMSHVVEPSLPKSGTFITEFPAAQASLAKKALNADNDLVAKRAELYWHGMEIANAYQELVDAAEQEARFKADAHYRQQHNLAPLPHPNNLVSALQQGFPECAGVALGVDRLLMILSATTDIRTITSFGFEDC